MRMFWWAEQDAKAHIVPTQIVGKSQKPLNKNFDHRSSGFAIWKLTRKREFEWKIRLSCADEPSIKEDKCLTYSAPTPPFPPPSPPPPWTIYASSFCLLNANSISSLNFSSDSVLLHKTAEFRLVTMAEAVISDAQL